MQNLAYFNPSPPKKKTCVWVVILWKEKSRALESYRHPTFKLAGGAERRCVARYAVPPESGGGRQGSLPSSYITAAWCNFGSESRSVLLHTTKLRWHNSSTRSRVCRPVCAWVAGALRVPVTRLASPPAHNVTVPYGCVCAKWVVFCPIKYLQLQTEWNSRPAWHSCLINVSLPSSPSSHPVVFLV